MRIVLTFLLNAGLNFAIGLAIAAVLGPDSYGRFAVGATAAVVLATACFDWLRLATTRFYGESQRVNDPTLRSTLSVSYLTIAGVLIVVALALAGLHVDLGVSTALGAAIVLSGIANGAFDFQAALARARFQDRAYVVLVIGKSLLGFLLALGAAYLFREPAVVLAAQGLGMLVAILPVRRELSDAELTGRTIQLRHVRSFATYGLPVVLANVVFQIILLMNRSVAASSFGYAAAGHLSLATDVSLRLLLASGAAIDVLLFQTAVRREVEEGRQAADQQLKRNMVIVAAVLLLLAVGFASTLPAFNALIVPSRYHGEFVHLALTILPGIFLFCLGQYAINPVFQMQHRTAPIIGGALVSLVVDGLGLALLPSSLGLGAITMLHAVSLAAGFVALAAVALRSRAVRPNPFDLAGIVLAGAVMALVLWPIRTIDSPALALCVAGLAGPLAYGAVLLALNVAGSREYLRGRLARFGSLPAAHAAKPNVS